LLKVGETNNQIRYIRFCLKVLGFYDESMHRNKGTRKDDWLLSKLVSAWVKRNYQDLVACHPPIAEAMLPASIEYDAANKTLIQTMKACLKRLV